MGDAPIACARLNLLRGLGRHRRAIAGHEAGVRAGQHAGGIQVRLEHHLVVRQRAEQHGRARRHVARRAVHGDAGDGGGPLGGVRRDVVHVHAPSGRRQVARHGEAHASQSDEADLALRHVVLPKGELNAVVPNRAGFGRAGTVGRNFGAGEHPAGRSAMRTKLVMAALLVVAVALGRAGAQTPGKVEIQWLGQAATKITSPSGKVIAIDPSLTAKPKTPAQYKNLDALGHVDLILVTHAHGDHLGDAPELAKKHNVPMWAPAGLQNSLVTLGVLPANLAPRMNKGGVIAPLGPDIKITMTRAEHSSELVWKNPATGKDETHVGGEPVGFIIQLENGFKIYHMGDTGLFGDMRLIGEYYKPDLLLIPIGGHFVMSPQDAAVATRDLIKPKFAIPIHYGTIPQLKGTPEEYLQALGQTTTKVQVLQPGEKTTF